MASSEMTAVCLMGPTASGKTDLALALCDEAPFEIVSVDSALVYRGMDIGTAKPAAAILERYPHHLVDIRDPSQPYSAADFREDVIACVGAIRERGHIPLLVGGTMLYFKALKDGLANLPSADSSVRESIAAVAKQDGWSAVHRRLSEVDPDSAARINPNDPQRLQRALEVYELTGRSMTELHGQAAAEACPFPLLEMAVVPPDRAALHVRIEQRFLAMLDAGLVEEVRSLYERGDLTPELPAIRAVGYRQVWAYLAGDLSYDEMVEKGVVATRQLAKRQYTWLRGWPDLTVLEAPEPLDALKILKGGSILD